jgi:DNA-binding CsgD family transcriptional regulator
MKTVRRKSILLSERECEVLILIAKGATSKEIGGRLGISNKTVEAHRENIKKKLKVNTIAQLVQCAVSLGLITPSCPVASNNVEKA